VNDGQAGPAFPTDDPLACDSGVMRFGNDYSPLLVTVFLIVWIIVGVLQIFAHF
jgi:hypothetical protein